MMPSKVSTKRPSFVLSVTSNDSSPVPSSPPSGESFEGFGENDTSDQVSGSSGGIDLVLAPHINSTPNNNNDEYSGGNLSRHTWSRTSLRRTPTSHETLPNRRWGSMRHSGRRQLGSNALASQLYRSSSFNSSGRSSNCDTTEDMYSDVSLEDVQDLNHKLEILQRQVSTLADSQSNAEDRTSRTKTEHAVLQARYHMLEDQLREVEIRAEERLNEEQKRHRELLARVEREAILQNENCQIKIRTIELETNNLREELQRLRTQYDKQTVELRTTTEKLEDVCDNLTLAREELTEAKENEKKYLAEKLAAEDLMIELGKEVERLRQECGPAMPTTSPETLRLEELHQEMEELRQAKKQLIEQNEELQAMVLTRGVEEGRNLLNGTSNSLAQEIDELNDRQDSVDSASTLASLTKLQAAYQEKEEENQRLKHYIDTILLNIVENYPQILEVKTNPMSNKR
ncbi:rab11 family-interacting protein 4B isoform X4 [Contarinia nasturtii]|uniref:rab11 family-interacting protein 4B isoform X4 n=1 Tax=Contarinia nasturtii TaxID=265458 RepID=UPI0012D3D480|nr:rab11 family-interacting protein 4B isoform X4 [Contarinia nasturtii]